MHYQEVDTYQLFSANNLQWKRHISRHNLANASPSPARDNTVRRQLMRILALLSGLVHSP